MIRQYLTLPAAEQIPAATITFVALLLFLQLGISGAIATALSASLLLPWALRDVLGSRLHLSQLSGWSRVMMVEAFLFLSLLSLAFFIRREFSATYLSLLVISALAACHRRITENYYRSSVSPHLLQFYRSPRNWSSQLMLILTYGVLIMVVGNLEVYYRQIPLAWTMGCYLLAGIFLVFVLVNFLSLRTYHNVPPHREKPLVRLPIVTYLLLPLLLLPQSLMFYTRVLYLMDVPDRGGLGCTIQEVCMAQGVVGVVAFSLGLAIGRSLMRWIPVRLLMWPFVVLLSLSPLVYLKMTIQPPQTLAILCLSTFQAQILFGLGLSACRILLQPCADRRMAVQRHVDDANPFFHPAVLGGMLLPLFLSGWLVARLGYYHFFLIDTLTAPLAWAACWLLWKKNLKKQ
ncbi:MAG: hypothetical protein HUK03_04975 [Bacteroidaceae bacterium]|nr:hypothetical protein [Bacteroidaceae bacterium]